MISFLRDNFRWIAGGFLLTFLSSVGQTFFISASVAEWQEKFDLSHGGFGRLYMVATLMSALILPFLGKIVDRIDEYKTILVCAPVLAAAALLAAYAPSALVLTAAIFLLRLFGQGMMTHIALTATGRWFAAQRGRAVSLVVLGHQAGEASLPLAFATVALAAGYQGGWMAAAGLVLLAGMPLAALAYAKPRTPKGTRDSGGSPGLDGRHWTRAAVLRDPIFYVLLLGVLAPPFIGTILFFHQDYLTALNDWPPNLFARGLSVMALTTVVFALITGALIDRFSAVAILPILLIPLALASLTLPAATGPGAFFGFMVLLGTSYGLSSTLFGSLWPEVYGTEHLGAVRSIIVSAMVFATAAGPGLTGTLIDARIALPDQVRVLGVYCLMVSGILTIARSVLMQRRAAELAPVDGAA